MRSRPATELLRLPVRLRGIRLGRPIDLLLDPVEWRALGFVVHCGDEGSRFLVFAAADLLEDAIDVSSVLLLLEDVGFYRDRSRSLRDLLGDELRDLLVGPDGSIEALVVERDGVVQRIDPTGVPVEPEHVSTA
ncbi:MAG: hypothetical protein E6G16_03430 [Actinobacteria bacterium]|nr:MAG: hypothetical protein E6G16_03430 [Actinomycetota bacterium]